MLHRCRPHLDVDMFLDRLPRDAAPSDDPVREFEAAFSRYQGATASIATNQGRSALLLAQKILGIKKGDEVIVQSFTCRTAINPLLQAGAAVRLVDIDEDFRIPIGHLRKKISKNTRAIIATHLYGVPCNIDEISDLAQEYDCYLIEDCAQCLGATCRGKKAGTFGHLAVFSFNLDKPISLGEGGMLTINDPGLADAAMAVKAAHQPVPLSRDKDLLYSLLVFHVLTDRSIYTGELSQDYLRHMFADKKLSALIDRCIPGRCTPDEPVAGIRELWASNRGRYVKMRNLLDSLSNYLRVEKLDDHLLMNSCRARFGLAQLETYGAVARARNENALRFERLLGDAGSFAIPRRDKHVEPSFLRYSILNRTGLEVGAISKMAREKGYEIGNYNWSKPIHVRAPYNKLIPDASDLKTSESISRHLLNLPVHDYVEEEDIINIANFLKSLA